MKKNCLKKNNVFPRILLYVIVFYFVLSIPKAFAVMSPNNPKSNQGKYNSLAGHGKNTSKKFNKELRTINIEPKKEKLTGHPDDARLIVNKHLGNIETKIKKVQVDKLARVS